MTKDAASQNDPFLDAILSKKQVINQLTHRRELHPDLINYLSAFGILGLNNKCTVSDLIALQKKTHEKRGEFNKKQAKIITGLCNQISMINKDVGEYVLPQWVSQVQSRSKKPKTLSKPIVGEVWDVIASLNHLSNEDLKVVSRQIERVLKIRSFIN